MKSQKLLAVKPEAASGVGRKLTALWHVKNLVGVNVLHFEILGGIVDEMVAGQVKFQREAFLAVKFANVVCGAPRGLSESGQTGGFENFSLVAGVWLTA